MKRLGLEIHLDSPAHFAITPPAANLSRTLEVIPGNHLRGVLAYRYIDGGGKPDGDHFTRLFLSGEVRFGFGLKDGSQVLPRSARSCKYQPGFPGPSAEGGPVEDSTGHGVLDLLLGEVSGGSTCPVCERALDRFEGFWHPRRRQRVEVERRLMTRSAIDPVLGTARRAQLYSQELLSEGQTFLAQVETGSAELAGELEELLSRGEEAFLGGGSSRGQGWVRLRPVPAPEIPPSLASERFQSFSKAFGGPILTLTLESDGLFTDDYLRPALRPGKGDLARLGLDPEDWEAVPERTFAASRRVAGFDGPPIRLPRIPRLATAAGSCWLFKARNPARPQTVPQGPGCGWIGENNREGFGRVTLWHPFHLDPENSFPGGAS